MHGRPIHTLEEDFKALGVLPEDGLDEMEPGMDPKMVALRKKKMQLQKKQLQMQKGKGAKEAMKNYMKGEDDNLEPEMTAEEIEAHLLENWEELGLEEKKRFIKMLKGGRRQVRVLTGREKALAKKKYKKAKRAGGFLMKKKMQKAARARGKKKHGMAVMPQGMAMEGLGNLIDALKYDSTTEQYINAYGNLAKMAGAVVPNITGLAEEFVHPGFDFAEYACDAANIADDAMEMIEALEEHEGEISVEDQVALQENLAERAEIAETIALICEEFDALVEGDEDEDEDENLDEMMGIGMVPLAQAQPAHASDDQGYAHLKVPMGHMGYTEYSEGPYGGPVKGWKNSELHTPASVMHPLGLTTGLRAVSDREREYVRKYLDDNGLGYGTHLDADKPWSR
jgi:hypothetical protein